MVLEINIRAKNPTIEISSKKINIIKDEEKVVNFMKQIREEVIQLPHRKRVKVRKKLYSILTGLILTLKANTAFAMTSQSKIVSNELMETMFLLVVLSVFIGICIAMVCGVIAGVMKMFNQRDYAERWTENIIKGVGQVILFPTIILAIVFLSHLLLGGNGFYIDIWKTVEVFVQLD